MKKHTKKEEKHPKEEHLAEDLHKLEKQGQELEALRDKYIRLGAEFDNARKRWEREKEDVIKFANYSLLKDLTIVLDEMEQALRMVKEHSDFEQIAKGIELTYNNLLGVLFKKGLKTIEAAGKKFDPHFHEIVASREIEEGDEHLVLEEIQKGYLFGDKVLRTSKVIVGVKKKEKAE
ncbi:MAG: nucleotide exchange factor GrpE [Candidatus Omnitrophota bacterium]|nr:MAG: nucleotide exchange factor GrpE [Candidatus Omnitrophota bacterium]